MKLNTSPGLDGLTVEFYRVFWNKRKYILTDVLNKGNDEQCLTYSQRTSILALLFKKGDHLNLDNYPYLPFKCRLKNLITCSKTKKLITKNY